MIEKCAFGNMVVGGRTYTADLLILPDGQIIDSWWRKAGHRLCAADIEVLVDQQPDIIIVGTGIHGVMKVPEDLVLALSANGIQLKAEKTPLAAQSFNQLKAGGHNVAGCFHLTC